MSSTPVIAFERVTKRFRLKEGNTLKEFLPALLRGKGISASFSAIEDLSFSLRAGETLGIVGRNGSGKSTILKLITGVTAPTSGSVDVRGRVSPLIELGAGFHPDLTGRENVFLNGAILGMSRRDVLSSWDDIVAFAEIPEFMDTPVKHYSSGMYLRLSFAVAVHSNPAILIIDEALAVGDAAFQQKCLDRIRQFQRAGITIVLVSHSLSLIEDFCPRALCLDHGRLLMDGPSDRVVDFYRRSVLEVAEHGEEPLRVVSGSGRP